MKEAAKRVGFTWRTNVHTRGPFKLGSKPVEDNFLLLRTIWPKVPPLPVGMSKYGWARCPVSQSRRLPERRQRIRLSGRNWQSDPGTKHRLYWDFLDPVQTTATSIRVVKSVARQQKGIDILLTSKWIVSCRRGALLHEIACRRQGSIANQSTIGLWA